jgi:hypothetical protein
MMDVILSEAKNLACGRQMFRLRLNMTTPQIISDRALVSLAPESEVRTRLGLAYHKKSF